VLSRSIAIDLFGGRRRRRDTRLQGSRAAALAPPPGYPAAEPCDCTATTCGFLVARSSRNCMRTLGSESGRQTRSCSRSSTTKVDRSSPTGPKISSALSTRPAESSFAFSKSATPEANSLRLWTCGQRKSVAHMPTASTNTKAKPRLNQPRTKSPTDSPEEAKSLVQIGGCLPRIFFCALRVPMCPAYQRSIVSQVLGLRLRPQIFGR